MMQIEISGGRKFTVFTARHTITMAAIGLAVGACLAVAVCRVYYSGVLQRDYVAVTKIDGVIASAMQKCEGDVLLSDPLQAPGSYP